MEVSCELHASAALNPTKDHCAIIRHYYYYYYYYYYVRVLANSEHPRLLTGEH